MSQMMITHRRNFLVRALGFTAAGAAVAVPIVTVASAEERLMHHVAGVEAAMRDLFPGAHVERQGNCLDGHHRTFAETLACGASEGRGTPAHIGVTAWLPKV